MRKPFVAGNWKMNLDRLSATALASQLRDHVGSRQDVEVAVVPPFVYLDEIARTLLGSVIRVGAQNVCDEASGAFTGEVSVAMLRDVGCDLVVIGHSERRHIYGETDELINRKVHASLAGGLDVILCVGETLDERQGGQTESRVRTQLTEGLAGVATGDMARVTIAYEPVWAIGTGQTASPEQASDVHDYLRGLLAGIYDQAIADATRIQYGGSVKPGNVAELMAKPGIDGALVGGAALSATDFVPIIDFDK